MALNAAGWRAVRKGQWRSFGDDKDRKKSEIEKQITLILAEYERTGAPLDLSLKYHVHAAIVNCLAGLYEISAKRLDEFLHGDDLSAGSFGATADLRDFETLDLAEFQQALKYLQQQPVRTTPVFWGGLKSR